MNGTRLWRVLVGASVAASSLIVWTGAAEAAGTPDMSLTKEMPDEVLLGDEIPVTLTFSNTTGTDGYNALIRDVLPAGVSYVPGSASPEPTLILPQGDGTTVLVWRNLADSLAGTSVVLGYRVSTDGSYDAGDTVTNDAAVYVNSNPRTLPNVTTPDGAVILSSFTGNDAATDTTTLVPFQITKSEPSAEDELLRGVHSHQTVYTLTIENNFVNPTTGFSVVDYVPAQLEFLGCGDADNTTSGEEYPGSGPIPNYASPLPNGTCVVPSSVTTVDTDPDGAGPMPAGVYTRVEWDSAAIIAARGSADLAASGTFAIDYVAAIPLRENTFPGPATATSNLDNNLGAFTTESETMVRNYAEATGSYNGATTYVDSDMEEVVLEDVSIHKTANSASFVQGQAVEFTLFVESSEYAVSTDTITVTDTIPAPLDFASSTPAPTSGPVLNPDGTLTYTWELPGFAAPSSTATIVVNTTVRDFYRDDVGANGSPVAANDTFTNTTDLATDATIITANTGATSVVPVVDDSSASLDSGGPSILKEVSVQAPSLTCGDGTGVTFDPDFAAGYRPGDRVCFRLSVDFPSLLDTLDPTVEDFLPAGFAFDSWTLGAGNTITPGNITFTDDAPVLRWDMTTDVDAGGLRFEAVVQTIVNDPQAAAADDIIENLMKVRYSNLSGAVFQLRDMALAGWAEPDVRLTKGVMTVNAAPVVGAPADGVSVREGDVVGYQVRVTNTDGTVDALAVSVRDVLPTGVTCADVSAISNGGACDVVNNWIQWDAADNIDIPAGNGTPSGVNLTYSVTVPVGVSAGATLVNTAGVRNFTGPTNTGTPFTYVPTNNIDPTLTPNTDPARDTSSIVTAVPTISKTATTGFTDTGNNAANEATVGETISYTVTVGVPNDLTYYNAIITDNLDAEKDLLAPSVSATFNGGALPVGFSLNVNDVTNRWNVTFPATYTAPAGPDPQIVVTFDAIVTDVASNTRTTTTTNRADFNYENISGTTRNVNRSVSTTIVEPNLQLAKTNDDPTGVADAGQVVNYTVTPSNVSGSRVSAAYDTVVVDTVPAQLTVLDAPGGAPVADGGSVGPDGGIWNAAARTITWSVATIAPGASVPLNYQVVVDDPLLAGASIRNDADARTSSLPLVVAGERDSTSPFGGPGTGYQATAFDVLTVSEFALVKNATPATASVGDTVSYTLDVTIPGGLIGYDVTVVDQIPAGVIFESLDSVTCPGCSPAITSALVVPGAPYTSGSDIAFFLDDLTSPSATDRVVTIAYTGYVADVVAANSGATLTNRATLYWSDTDTITSPPTSIPNTSGFNSTPEAPAAVGTVEPQLTIDKDVNGQVADTDTRRAVAGETLTYSVTVRNTGNGPAYDVTVTDVPTDDTWAFTDTTVAGGVTNIDSDPVGGLAWTIDGPIAPNASVVISYTLVVPAGYDSANENPIGPEQTNVADVPSYFGVSEATRTANPTRSFRDYDNVVADTVTIELDLASIGDLVWYDVDGDGVRDPGEPGIANTTVTVTYLGLDNAVGGGDDEVFTVSTGADGSWLVENLPGGQYTVDVDEADPDFIVGLTPTYDLDGTTVSPNGFWAGSLGQDEDKTDVDFGYTGTGSIGNLLWFDQNRNGTQDPGEDGLGGVTVNLTWFGPNGVEGDADDVSYAVDTDVDGNYLFENLPAGGYTVSVDTNDLPADYINVFDPDGGVASESLVLLAAGQTNLAQDFGYAGVGSIGDTIYLDRNGNGIRELDDLGLEGITVDLVAFGPDGVLGGTDDSFFTTVTGPGGLYLFENLPQGNYEVTVSGAITTLVNTDDPDLAGAPDVGDSVSTTTLTALAPNDLTQDFGYTATSVLGDRIWLDIDGNGAPDSGEPGLENVEVTAVGPFGLTFTTTTNANGDYLFANLPDGDWTVTVNAATLPAGVGQTFDADGLGTANTSSTTLATEDLAQDFGYAGTGVIGDTIWLDLDGNGVLDGEEVGLEGVTVTLEWAQPGGTPITISTTTGAGGIYRFEHLPAGDFTITVDETTLPAGVAPTFDPDGGDDSMSSVTLAIGETNLAQDFGYNGGGAIGDTIWFDRNGDGVFDADETPLEGIRVIVTWDGPTGPETFTATTDANGEYLVGNLPPGDYTVAVVTGDLPTGMVATFDADGGADSSSMLTLADGEINRDQDFGYNGTALIGDTVYLDSNGNGIQDPGESGIPGQLVELVWNSPTGLETYTTTTASDGTYLFDNLPAGGYVVTVVGGIVDLADNTGEPGPEGDSTNALTLAVGEQNRDQDFGYQGINALGDTVWFDVNADGIDDGAAAEPRLDGVGVTVVWFGLDGVAGTSDDVTLPVATTDANGIYSVGNLPDGSYSVTVTAGVPAGLDVDTFDADGGNDRTSIVVDLGVSDTAPVIVLDQDFGVTGDGSIGDVVWLDLDADGIQDPNEPGIPGVLVTLTWSGPDGDLSTTADNFTFPVQTTDTDGGYLFENLPAGAFQVVVANLPAGVTSTYDPDGATPNESVLTLTPGGDDLDQDFGYVGDASIGDTIWLDVNRDGVQDTGEPGVAFVTVTVTAAGADGVLDTADDVVTTVDTDADGQYLVDGLPAGPVRVSYDTGDLGPGTQPGSDLDGADLTETTTTLSPGEDRRDVDFGVIGTATITGSVWEDMNRDGVKDADEVGLPDITVDVTWEGPTGPITITVVTDENGEWSIDDVPPGDYTVTVRPATVPNQFIATTPNGTVVNVPPGGTNNVDNGYVPGSSIGDTVWVDRNRNGVQDAGELGVPGVTVLLLDSGGNEIARTETDPDGKYLFDDLPAGVYTVVVVTSSLPVGLGIVFDSDGTTDGRTTVTLGVGEDNPNIDFGVDAPAPLPRTGGGALSMLPYSMLLIASGVILLGVRRRRNEEIAPDPTA